MRISRQNIIFLLPALALSCCGKRELSENSIPEPQQVATEATDKNHNDLHASLAKLPGQNAISQRCQECHKDIHHHWQKSHHGQANRLLDLALDSEPFANKKFDGVEKWRFHKEGEKLTVTANDKEHNAGMAIGVDPLVQYLVAASGGRWQTPSAAWDPHQKEWFDVFGGDQRTEADWGHWSGRGMTWNTQCAWCHMTDYQKNYDIKSDTYNSQWSEMGVGCTQCHGDVADEPHAESGCLIDIPKHREMKKANPDLVFENCATCHSRRAAYDDNFHVGAKFGDHFHLQLPTQPHLYYADGQILDEDYVWTSLRISNMGHKGVRCSDCHDPHSNQLKLPLTNNALCMSCHSGGSNGRISGATIIDPVSHSHHFNVGKHNDVGSGHSCVDCHMTETTYMGRDHRRDHGFHVPDPILTKEHNIPNACNKCHTDQDTDWAIKWTKEWYGDKLHSPERKRQRARTRAIADVYAGNTNSPEGLLAAHDNEPNPYWQASLLQIMQVFATDPRVQQAARQGVHSEESIVRAAACQLLEFSPESGPWIEPMLQDPVKEVRMAAAWAWRTRLSQQSAILKELKETSEFSADQPTGAMRMAQLASESNKLEEAEKWMQKAISLDQTSPRTHEYYAILLGQMGRPKEALTQLETASRLDPQNGHLLHLQALTHAELGDLAKTEQLLRQAIEISPGHAQAHKNLGLLLAGQNKLDAAINSLRQAEQLEPGDPSIPYARATIHLRKGQKMEAFEACRNCLGIDRNYQPAIQLLRQIGNPGTPTGQ
ncbi:MAG: tetratricopeptide repeat protein [Akkermansiaceae bacterium]